MYEWREQPLMAPCSWSRAGGAPALARRAERRTANGVCLHHGRQQAEAVLSQRCSPGMKAAATAAPERGLQQHKRQQTCVTRRACQNSRGEITTVAGRPPCLWRRARLRGCYAQHHADAATLDKRPAIGLHQVASQPASWAREQAALALAQARQAGAQPAAAWGCSRGRPPAAGGRRCQPPGPLTSFALDVEQQAASRVHRKYLHVVHLQGMQAGAV